MPISPLRQRAAYAALAEHHAKIGTAICVTCSPRTPIAANGSAPRLRDCIWSTPRIASPMKTSICYGSWPHSPNSRSAGT